MGHPYNAVLDQVVDRYGHLPIKSLHLQSVTGKPETARVVVEFPTCGDYEAATRIASKKPHDGGRGLRDRRVYDHLDRDGHVLEHHCWPNLDCAKERAHG